MLPADEVTVLFRKMAYIGKHTSTWEFWNSPTILNSFRVIGGERNTWRFFRDWIVVIAFAFIVLAWLTVTLTEERRKSEDRWFARLVLQWCSPANLNHSIMPDSAHGSLWPILHRHFQHVICALLLWPPFFSGSSIWRTTVRHDRKGKRNYPHSAEQSQVFGTIDMGILFTRTLQYIFPVSLRA